MYEIDLYLLHRAQALRVDHPHLVDVMRDMSALGSTVLLTLLALITVVYLALVGSRPMAALVGGAVVTGAVMVDLMKAAFERLRPDAAFAEMAAQGLSFSSGHSSISAIVYLTLGALVASTRTRLVEQTYILAVSAVMTGLVGISRVALGVHRATDVMAGWAFGAAWAIGVVAARGTNRAHRHPLTGSTAALAAPRAVLRISRHACSARGYPTSRLRTTGGSRPPCRGRRTAETVSASRMRTAC